MSIFADSITLEQAAINQALADSLLLLPEPVRHVADYGMMSGGKRLRPFLVLLTARLFEPGKKDAYPLAASLEMVHVATLLHDDILDGAESRRGKNAAHREFGTTPCLLAGDSLMAAACKMVAEYDVPALVGTLADAMMRTVAGEAHEIALKGRLDHGIDTYLDIVIGKTAWLLRAACRMGALYAGATDEQVRAISDYGLNMGIAFQMVDDALDFADEAVTGKPTGGDLREGKFTPPVVRYAALLEGEEKKRFSEKFAAGEFTDEEVAAISKSIREHGFDSQTRDQADEYLDRAARSLDSLPPTRERDLLRQALDFVRDRKK